MDDELFGDLLGPKPGAVTTSKAQLPTSAGSVKGATESSAKAASFNGADDDGRGLGTVPVLGATDQNRMVITLSHEELTALVDKGVQSALDVTFSKFARSLRTVLEDMTRRIASQEATVVELRAAINDLSDVVAQQPSELHGRFTNLDMAIKDVERGVQAMRDRQELQEAQQLLAMMTSESTRNKAQSTSSAGAPPPNASGFSPAPAEATSPAPSAPAPSPAPASAPSTAATASTTSAAATPPPAANGPVVAPLAAVAAATTQPSGSPAAPGVAMLQQAPYGMPQQMAPAVQPQPIPHHMPGYPLPAPVPGAPPLPMQQPPEQAPQQAQQAQQPQQQPLAAPLYPYQTQAPPGGMGAPPMLTHEMTGYATPQAPPAQHPPPMYQLYGAPPQLEAARAPSMVPQGMPQHMGPPQLGGQGAGGSRMDMPTAPQSTAPPPPQMVSYPSPSMHAYPPPPAVPVMPPPGMYGRQQQHTPSAGYRPLPGPAPQPSSAAGGGGGPGAGSRAVPLDKIISDIAQMGFNRSDVQTAVHNLQASGKALDLNTIIDKLTRG